jgi:hypothetical protein
VLEYNVGADPDVISRRVNTIIVEHIPKLATWLGEWNPLIHAPTETEAQEFLNYGCNHRVLEVVEWALFKWFGWRFGDRISYSMNKCYI